MFPGSYVLLVNNNETIIENVYFLNIFEKIIACQHDIKLLLFLFFHW